MQDETAASAFVLLLRWCAAVTEHGRVPPETALQHIHAACDADAGVPRTVDWTVYVTWRTVASDAVPPSREVGVAWATIHDELARVSEWKARTRGEALACAFGAAGDRELELVAREDTVVLQRACRHEFSSSSVAMPGVVVPGVAALSVAAPGVVAPGVGALSARWLDNMFRWRDVMLVCSAHPLLPTQITAWRQIVANERRLASLARRLADGFVYRESEECNRLLPRHTRPIRRRPGTKRKATTASTDFLAELFSGIHTLLVRV
jgi:hypothetical protein